MEVRATTTKMSAVYTSSIAFAIFDCSVASATKATMNSQIMSRKDQANVTDASLPVPSSDLRLSTDKHKKDICNLKRHATRSVSIAVQASPLPCTGTS